jgi:UTP--glucose-1-phosphate uridylyltransferase
MPFQVKKAVIPAAGLGTRMWPLTGGAAKEMLPVGSKPMIHHAVQEALAAGLEEICIVIREGKEVIRRYFEEGLCEAERSSTSDTLKELRARGRIIFAYQAAPRGIGDAMLCAREFVGSAPFALIIPDQLFIGRVTPIAQLAMKELPTGAVISSLIIIPLSERPYFPGTRGFVYKNNVTQGDAVVITGIIGNDSAGGRGTAAGGRGTAPGFGRTLYPPDVFRFLGADFADGRTGEVDLFKTFQSLLVEVPNYGVFLEGEAFDLGTVAGYRHFEPRLRHLL